MNRGRPIEFDLREVLDAAVEVFWRQGYEATSMIDLLEAMSLSKSSLYQTFGGKQQLFERCLDHYAIWLSAKMARELAEAKSGKSFIHKTFESVANTAQLPEGAKGCLIANSANEFGQREPSLAVPVANGLQRLTQVFVKAITRAQSEGDIPADADPHVLANYLLGTMNGLRTMIKAGTDQHSAKGMVSLILKALE